MMSFELIIKYLSGKATPIEAQQLDNWVEASPANRENFASIEAAWLSAGNETMRIPKAKKQWKKFNKSRQPKGKIITLGRFAAAASLVGVCFLAYYFLINSPVATHSTFAQTTVDTVVVTLADSSVVNVYPGSKLDNSTAFTGKTRNVSLSGSAFFTIEPDKNKPFIINAGECTITVLGTSFEVVRAGKSVIVSVETGTVLMQNPKGELTLNAGETGVYNHFASSFAMSKATSTVITGSFEFEDRPLSEVIAVLSKHFNTKISLENAALNTCRVKLSFENETLENIVDIISVTLNISSRNKDGKIIFSGSGCP